MEAYINHRIVVAGGGRAKLFNRRAVSRIFSVTRGIPRLINSLCDRALLGAYTENRDHVDDRIVKKAAREILGDAAVNPAGRLRTWSLALAALAFGVLVAIWYLDTDDQMAEPPTTPTLTKAPGSEPSAPAVESGSTVEEGDGGGQYDNSELWTLAPDSPDQGGESGTETTRIIIEPIEIAD
jgi:general secretion pathway protein A